MFGKYNGFVSKARVSACMYFLVIFVIVKILTNFRNSRLPGHGF
jgi:hypothetical protein